ncbi:MAG: Gfo/Idh/MocA family oxidoreductase [Alphaproteobacteria bacterium]|nr:Gfo/Idh/MocA family oxidoreductase [Alphaproteobacteria bacterium]
MRIYLTIQRALRHKSAKSSFALAAEVCSYVGGGENERLIVKPLGVGVVGANLQGSWGVRAHLPALCRLEDVAAVAVTTSHREAAEATASQFRIPHVFDDARALAEHPEVDVVAICVRVPYHFELVMAALDAGKHVYCEWPLGRDSEEALELQRQAEGRGVTHMVGLQARSSPLLHYVRDLVSEGIIGTVRSVGLTHSVAWPAQPPPSMAYLQDRSSGAHFLSIPGGHSVDALCWLFGEFRTLSATMATTIPNIEIAGTGEQIVRSSADQIVVSGALENGAVACLRLSGGPSAGTGIRLEVNGDKGDLVIVSGVGGRGIQMSDLRLYRTTGLGKLEMIAVPDSYFPVPGALRSGPPLNVACAYVHLAKAIREGVPVRPNFADAVLRHRTLDRIERAAEITLSL